MLQKNVRKRIVLNEISQFVDFLAYERGLSEKTRLAYESDLTAFLSFLSTNRSGVAGDIAVGSITHDDVLSFQEYGKKNGLAENTLARRLVAIKVFFAYLRDEKLIDFDPAAMIYARKRNKILPHSLSEQSMCKLLTAPPENTRDGIRDRAILELFYSSGLRVSELAGLQMESIRFDEALVRCTGKGSKVRLIPLGTGAENALKKYYAESRPKYMPDVFEQSVFLNRLGRKMSREGVWGIVKHHSRAAGLGDDVSPHWIRH